MGCSNKHIRILTRHPNRWCTVLVDRRHQLRVHRTQEHHADNLHSLGVCNSQSIMKSRLLAKSLHHRRNLWPTAVYDDWLEPNSVQQCNVLGKRSQRVVTIRTRNSVAAVFDNHCFARKFLNVRQRFNQQVCYLGRVDNRLIDCRASIFRHGYTPTLLKPKVSSRPSATLAACTAPPAAPFVKLSIADNTTT